MNSLLKKLKPYPFERLNQLLDSVKVETDLPMIPLSLGEPKHAAPDFLLKMYQDAGLISRGFGTYPPTKGLIELREAIRNFVVRRFNLPPAAVDSDRHILPVNGTREALFAIAQVIQDPGNSGLTFMPNPFYQIYEGAALLGGNDIRYIPCVEENNFLPEFSEISAEEWRACELVYICTPGNPTGAVMDLNSLQQLIRLADKHNFVIVSDECYSELYTDESAPPPGILEACAAMGRLDFSRCIAFNSLSKRSNLPGLRSGYAVGDADIISSFLLYRTYHGSAMSVHNQLLSAAAWNDEEHVLENRKYYRAKFEAVLNILAKPCSLTLPAAGFYLWPLTDTDDESFTQDLYRKKHVKVVPGSYLSRTVNGVNPGANRVRMALVAPLEECADAAERINQFISQK